MLKNSQPSPISKSYQTWDFFFFFPQFSFWWSRKLFNTPKSILIFTELDKFMFTQPYAISGPEGSHLWILDMQIKRADQQTWTGVGVARVGRRGCCDHSLQQYWVDSSNPESGGDGITPAALVKEWWSLYMTRQKKKRKYNQKNKINILRRQPEW